MAAPFYGQTHHMLGADTSDITSPNVFTGDFQKVTLSIRTGSAFASRITVQACNLDGFQSTLSENGGFGNTTVPIGGWSHLTVILPTGVTNIFTIAAQGAGSAVPRWINVLRSTQVSGQTDSNVTVTLYGHT